jgi:hypothetical protein
MQISAGTGAERSWAVQASPEEPAHGRDRVLRLRFFQRTRGSELLVESDVAVERFLGGDEPVWSQHLVFHGFNAKATYPSALVPVTDAKNVCRGTLLREPARVTFYRQDFHWRRDFGVGWMSLGACDSHWSWQNIELSLCLSLNLYMYIYGTVLRGAGERTNITIYFFCGFMSDMLIKMLLYMGFCDW